MTVNPLLITLCREYVRTVDAIGGGRFRTSHELHGLEGERGMLHDQLLCNVNADDYHEAQQDTYAYAVKVARWSRLH